SDDVRVVRYEDLVADPEGAMASVCDFLGVPARPATTRPTVMGNPYSGNSRFQEALEG
ncbi:MAG: sulfotransferase, partial [Gemmatimonadetes bacterium]|nr:sulfotransferase [Gemmatimonadota bacterium]NIT85720.1 sulfotransferase [Gemmatimonadota bacterium]NIU29551.1 sulfotransferase [Gemmatimonadota bacterium]